MANDDNACAWDHRPGEALVATWRGRPWVTCVFNTTRCKPYFHPLYTPAGVPMTAFEPWDHVWHRGLWFSWKYLNGVNYWEERDPVTEPEGRTVFDGTEEVELAAARATVKTRLHYAPLGGEPILRETRAVTIHAPDAAASAYAIDFNATWTAETEVTFDRTLPCEKTPWGGYAGFSWRAARTMGKFDLRDSEGRTGDDVHGQPARWVSLSGLHDGRPVRAAGLALIDHPANPRHPTPWYRLTQPGFGFIAAAPLFHEPLTLLPGKGLHLKYRAIVFDGPADPVYLDQRTESFAKT